MLIHNSIIFISRYINFETINVKPKAQPLIFLVLAAASIMNVYYFDSFCIYDVLRISMIIETPLLNIKMM